MGNRLKLRLQAEVRLADLLTHLYVPFQCSTTRNTTGWATTKSISSWKRGVTGELTPCVKAVTLRYLKHRRSLYRDALERLAAGDDPEPEEQESEKEQEEATLPIRLSDQRLGAVLAVLRDSGATHVLDLGCGEGKLVGALTEQSIARVVGVDVSMRSLERASDRLKLDHMPEMRRKKVVLFQGSLTYRDRRYSDCDAACAIEVIEHIDASRLNAFERVLFEFQTTTVVITTPNIEYNGFASLPMGRLRHQDHRFEWTRQNFDSGALGSPSGMGTVCASCRSGRRTLRSVLQHRWRCFGNEDRSARAVARCARWNVRGGKSTFAKCTSNRPRYFRPDTCRALVSDNENDQSVTGDAFDVLHYIAAKRLAAGRLTVIDATNVQAEARKPIMKLAREHDVLPVAIAEPPAHICHLQPGPSRPSVRFSRHSAIAAVA